MGRPIRACDLLDEQRLPLLAQNFLCLSSWQRLSSLTRAFAEHGALPQGSKGSNQLEPREPAVLQQGVLSQHGLLQEALARSQSGNFRWSCRQLHSSDLDLCCRPCDIPHVHVCSKS